MYKWFDQLLDVISQRLAENIVSNTETVTRNKAARELSALPDTQLQEVGLSKEKLSLGSEAYPWYLTPANKSVEDLEQALTALAGQTMVPDAKHVLEA
ncbi:MAG: hypothetical protein AAFZ92_05025 [Pseudomonadota bacterium]